jgi:hypothetical protein
MKKNQKLSLIEGVFDPKEAEEILIGILSNKIQFHQMRTFSAVERFGKEDENSLNIIMELKKSINKLLQLVTQAELSNKQLVITSHINIQIKEETELSALQC